ncbi:hypothetical protein DBR32_10195 [Taibaiella sp. KBW10]|uniref:T9SS type A sorting domain-containing protein n=1 Tax=Taibaiella sp. KBW10 TaxID=2153357 RepID=UPI000F58F94A|nr:T9SS type A sorting domain-containing protein [Taibaiella sp. KBW10]RQO31066.1 hypothetical protein DBR32_10195 [Taibaiella sp. KBW10]
MKKILSLLFITGCLQANAQSWEWLRSPNVVIGGNSGFKKIDLDNSGNVYSVGTLYKQASFGSTTLNSPGEYLSLFLSKQDAGGNYQFAQRIWADSGIFSAVMKLDDNANVYVFGTCGGTKLHLSPTDSISFSSGGAVGSVNRLFLAKYNSSGTLIWVKKGEAPSFYANARGITSIGSDIYIGGDYYGTCSFLGQNMVGSPATKSFLMKVDASGNGTWLKSSSNNAMCFITRLTNDGSNIYATGKFQNSLQFDNINVVNPYANPGGERIFLFKFNSSGTAQWGKEEGGAHNYVTTAEDANNPNALAYDGNGYLYVGGSYQDSAGTIFNQLQKPTVSKYDANTGAKIWTARFPSEVENAINGIAIDSNRNLICVGEYKGSFTAGGINLPTDNTARKGMIMKLNSSDGACTAASMIGNLNYTANVNEILMAPNKSYYIIGGIYKENLDISTFSLNSSGFGTPFNAKYNLGTPLSTHNLTTLSYNVYPNPCHESLNITRTGNESATISIIDISGKLVHLQSSNNQTTSIDVSRLAAGQYFLSVLTEKGKGVQAFIKR